jgi:hypothetical protein
MTRLYDTVGWLLSSLGLALLVCGWVLVPQNRLLGEPNETIEIGLQCPTVPGGGACVEPGKPCRFFNLPSACALSPNEVNCTCPDPR